VFQQMVRKLTIRSLPICMLLLGMSVNVSFATPLSADNFNIYGDFRTRLEYDWNSKKGDGSERDDRLRTRIRGRIGLNYTDNDRIKVGFRIRTGSDDSQQSPHITILDFDGNNTGDADLNFDKWFFQYSVAGTTTWVGRNSLNWFNQDELEWDDDVTPAGVGFTWKGNVGDGSQLTFNTGFYTMPEGMQKFRGRLTTGQLVFETTIGGVGLTLAGGYKGMDGETLRDPCGEDEHDGTGSSGCRENQFLQGNGERDYGLLESSVQLNFGDVFGKQLKLGVDYNKNLESYSGVTDTFTQFHKNNDTSWTTLLLWGDTKKGNWLFGYFYTYKEMLGLNSSMAEDDWVRWGNGPQTRSSNFKGSEFRVATGLADNLNLVLRVYIVKAIDLVKADDVSKEDANRARLDLNYKF